MQLEPEEIAAITRLANSQNSGVWFTLSALRGPDAHGDVARAIKFATTAVIRAKLGITSVHLHINKDSAVHLETRLQLDGRLERAIDRHFVYHAEQAFEALGLYWNEVNEF